ncbi:TetR family transcriptional regulator [Brevibacillus parabrevis]|jgi:Transcriptional regulator|uniref:TetR/AcrR family transcriptional regulator n=1 Tax=Brevibacillus parabrevis TaxID=54914 RepID=UPI0007AC0EE7|nr:TetR/AcrR family transcriptional regulator [Brevibacillus parabrevis]KZE50440.1 TetR family transcriptional regulator [Brevibacillus parabrevis]
MSETKRELILEAAMVLFEQRGFDGTTVPMIVDKAGVGAGTLYRYFENKEALVNTLFQECVNDVLETLNQGYPHDSNDSRKQFAHIAKQLVSYANKNLTALLFVDSHVNGYYLDEASQAAYMRLRTFFYEFIDQGKKNEIIRPLPADALIAIIDGAFISLYKSCRAGEIEETPELLAGVEEACWDAIRIH